MKPISDICSIECHDSNRVDNIVRKFKSKYGEEEVKKYYTKFDVAVEVPL